jgi:hypothetical protein
MDFVLTAEEADRSAMAHHVATVVTGGNADLIAEVARLYLPDGARVADVTYGQGVFWRKVDLGRYTLMGSDLQMDAYRRGQLALFGGTTPHFLAADFCALLYQEQCLDVVVFDPPYLHNPGGFLMNDRYRNQQTTKGMYHRDILRDCYCRGLVEAWRVVRPGGTVWVKGKDEIESGKQCWLHDEVHTAAKRLGFVAIEQFFLVTTGGQLPRPTQRQLHALKNQSWLWVFRRPQAGRRATRGRPKKGSVVTTHKQQRGRSYWQSRLLRDHPEVYARYMAGELDSIHAAAKQAGLVKGR